MSEQIALPAVTGERLADYQRRAAEWQAAMQVTVTTAAEALGVPAGWQFDLGRMAFVAPAAAEGAPTHDAE